MNCCAAAMSVDWAGPECYACSMPTRSSKPAKLDANQLAKHVLDVATGDALKTESPPAKNEAAVALGRLGGKKGGVARATKLTSEQRSRIAKNAAASRWKSHDNATTPPDATESSKTPKSQPTAKRRITF